MYRKPRKKEKNNLKTKKVTLSKRAILIIIAIILIITIAITLARYVVSNDNEYFSRTTNFYFYSDKLYEDGATYQIENWTGIDSYTITINMNTMENNILALDYDVAYTISYECSDNAVASLSKTEGIIYASSNTDYFTLTLSPTSSLETGDSMWVEIEAKTTEPYVKTLSATFTLVVGNEDLTYEIVDSKNSPYLEVNITNTLTYYTVEEAFGDYSEGEKITSDTYLSLSDEEKEKCYSGFVTLTFDPSYVLLDTTSNNYLNAISSTTTTVNDLNYVNSISFKVDAISSSTVRFYKVDVTQDYTYPEVNDTSIITVDFK